MSPPSSTPASSKSSQWLFGAGVIGFALVLQILPTILFHRAERFWPSMMHWLVQMPLLIGALVAAHRIARRQEVSALAALLWSMGTAVTVGALAGILSHYLVIELWGQSGLRGPPGAPNPLARSVFFGAMSGVFTAGFWVLGFVYPSSVEAQRILQLQQERFEIERRAFETESALHQLRARLEPHFLLNTLNAISSLVTQDPKQARRLIAILGNLLSDSLRDDELQPLNKELKWLRDYTSLLETRFAEKLNFEWQVDEQASDVPVPHLLLQPLVENAVNHGALRAKEKGLVAVRIRRKLDERGRDGLVCEVRDYGPGIDLDHIREGAFGLAAVRRRLALWDEDAVLSFDTVDEGTLARVWFPIERNE